MRGVGEYLFKWKPSTGEGTKDYLYLEYLLQVRGQGNTFFRWLEYLLQVCYLFQVGEREKGKRIPCLGVLARKNTFFRWRDKAFGSYQKKYIGNPVGNPLGNEWWPHRGCPVLTNNSSKREKCLWGLMPLEPPHTHHWLPHLFTLHMHQWHTPSPALKQAVPSFTKMYTRYLLVSEATVCLYGCTLLPSIAPSYKRTVMAVFWKIKKGR